MQLLHQTVQCVVRVFSDLLSDRKRLIQLENVAPEFLYELFIAFLSAFLLLGYHALDFAEVVVDVAYAFYLRLPPVFALLENRLTQLLLAVFDLVAQNCVVIALDFAILGHLAREDVVGILNRLDTVEFQYFSLLNFGLEFVLDFLALVS